MVLAYLKHGDNVGGWLQAQMTDHVRLRKRLTRPPEVTRPTATTWVTINRVRLSAAPEGWPSAG